MLSKRIIGHHKEVTNMKRIILLALSLVMLTVMGFALNIQPVSATGEGLLIVSKVGALLDYNTIRYTYVVKNTALASDPSSKTFKNVYIEDDKFPGVQISVPDLAPGQEETVYKDYTITDADRQLGRVTNTAKAHGKLPPSPIDWKSPPYSCTFPPPGSPALPVPEIPAGILLGLGLAGIGTFIVIRRKKGESKV
jgi:hypothetical protein